MLNKTIIVILASCMLAGCAIPGSTLSTRDKNVVEGEDDSADTLSSRINVYPLTPNLINKLKYNQLVPTTQPNDRLEKQLASYQYKIGPGDVLNVTIWDHPELTIPAGSYRSSEEAGNWVHSDGTIFYPYIGKLKVTGLTVTQVRSLITERIKKYIEAPQVDVNIAAFRSQKTYVTGEVNEPGPQPISNIPLTLLDAINRAGGITKDADWRNVTLTHHGKEEHLSLYALVQKGDLTQNRLLHKGDIIHVPRNDAQKVFIMGSVENPKMVKIDRTGMSLTEALASSGGINEAEADATGVFVIRSTGLANKQEKGSDKPLADVYQLNMQDATSLVMGTEFELKPYDVVYVTTAPVARWNRLMTHLVPTINNFNNLTQGMLRVKDWE
ncbi:polysaccharide export protein [Vibrio rumoiensis]|uniref:polysaccharide export protein n=1 Tax=Vibrio rumoiensis TaxID=76258 RepID=UPI003AA87803